MQPIALRAVVIVLTLALTATSCGNDRDDLASSQILAATPAPVLVPAPTSVPTTAPIAEPSASASVDASAAEPTSVASAETAPTPTPTTTVPPGFIELMVPEVIETYPHDNTAYTQGLEVLDGLLAESTGRQGHPNSGTVFESDLRLVDPATGNIVLRADAPGTVFAEGLTRVDDELVQLTWKDELAFYWHAETLEFLGQVEYEGQGWGLCYDGERLVMTNGGASLYFRDPDTFALLDEITVTLRGNDVFQLNELECLDGKVWANVYRTDSIVRIDPSTGVVDGIVDASSLEQPRVSPTEVLNGIAFDDTTSTWLVTGKFWPTMYRVEFVTTAVVE